MSLLFNNVELLGYTHQNNFFGEKAFNYSVTKTISLRGFTLNLINNNSIQNVVNAITSIKNSSNNFINVTINNANYGIGKVTQLSFDNDNWISSTRFNASITILEEIPMQSLSSVINSKEFNNVNLNGKKLNLIRSFSERFSLNFDTQNKVIDGEHNIDIEYDADNKNINLINLAQILAGELLKTIPSDPNIAEGNYITRQKYKVFNSENYNTVTGKCGFKRKFSYSTLNNDKNYSFVRTHSVQIDENGIATASENCNIKGENDEPSLYESALKGFNELINDAFGRTSNVFESYKTKFNIIDSLNTEIISKSVQVNKFLGTINYTINFDNDPKKENALYLFEYTNTVDRDDKGIWTASEKGTIQGRDKIGSPKRYQNAENGWNTNKGSIEGRVNSFYNAEAKNGSGSLKDLSKNISRNPYKGKIEYTYSYTDDRTILKNDPNGITRLSVEKSDTDIMPLIKDFVIPNKNYALSQNRNFKKQGSYTVKVNMEIGCIGSNIDFNSFRYFDIAKQKAGNFNQTDSYLESISYSSEETEKTITYQATYKYS
jgi:hypothetical protein